MNIKEILYEVIKEASNGKVIIDNEEYYIKFNSIIDGIRYGNDDNVPLLDIRDNRYFTLVEEYINKELLLNRRYSKYLDEREHIKMLITYIFVNSSINDFKEPIKCIERKIRFLDNKLLRDYNKNIELNNIFSSTLNITNSFDSIYSETSNIMSMNFTSNDGIYYLPSINYDIDGDTCYIYSIMNKNDSKNKDTKLGKRINRLLYKLNDGLIDDEADESIKDVSLSFVLALSIFISILKNNNINKIKVVSYLPLRYISRDIASKEIKELKERNDMIQNNASNKLIRTFNRCAYHIDGLDITNYPFDVDEYLNIDINNLVINNDLIRSSINK